MSDPKPCPICRERTRDGLTCWTCIRRTKRDLHELPWLYLETRRASVGMVRLAARNGGKSAETPLPVNTHAAALADRVRNGVVGWARIAIDRGAPVPRDTLAGLCDMLAESLRDLRRHEAITELAADVHRWTADMVRTINRPDSRRIEVGPCPLDVTDDDGTKTRCTGTVWAIFPDWDWDVPVHAACSWCCDPDVTPMIGLWVSEEWRTLGRLMRKRQRQDEAAWRLARAILGQAT